MKSQPSSFRTLMSQVKAGTPDALRRLVGRYGPRVQRAVRRRMHRKLQSKFDSTDFAQNVWASFFSPKFRSRVERIETPTELIRLLMTMARNKTIEEIRRRLGTLRYGVDQEISTNASSVQEQLHAPTPTPSQTAIAKETWGTAQDEIQSGMFRVVELRVEGDTFEEIAEKCDIHERTARRIIRRLERKMRSSGGEPASDE